MKSVDNNSDLKDYSKELDKRLQNRALKQEQEIENIKKINEKRIDDIKNEGDVSYINTIKRNDDLLVDASKDYEEKLNNYKERLDKTQNAISLEENALKRDHSEKIKNQKDQFQNNIKEQFQNASDNQQSIQNQTQNSMATVSNNERAQINHLELTAHSKANAISSEYNQKEITSERDYRAALLEGLKNHQADVNLQRDELQKNLDTTAEKNKRLETEKVKAQTAELNYLDNHQKDILAQKQIDFGVRYENLVKEHESLISELKAHFAADVKKMVEQNSSQKRVIANKNDDQFYRIEKLNPNISEGLKEYQVSLTVPEHEKENVHLSIHGRNIKMTLTRQYTDSFEEKDGSIDKSNRNELFSKEFPCKDLLNQKQVVQKYEDGVLTFKIQKL